MIRDLSPFMWLKLTIINRESHKALVHHHGLTTLQTQQLIASKDLLSGAVQSAATEDTGATARDPHTDVLVCIPLRAVGVIAVRLCFHALLLVESAAIAAVRRSYRWWEDQRQLHA